MPSRLPSPLRGNINCILNAGYFQFGNEMLVSFDKKDEHYKLNV